MLTSEQVQKFARRARRYIMGYHVFQLSTNTEQENSTIIPIQLEQMVKKFKMHRCALDFDYSFCKEVFNETAE
jgi:hypothetical protein